MTIDVVDATEPDDEAEVKTIRGAGIDPIVMAGMSGAVEQVVENIIRRAAGLALLSDLAAVFELPGGLGGLDEQTHILAAAHFNGCAPTWFVTSELSEVAYYIALRACLVRHSQSAAVQPAVVLGAIAATSHVR